MAGDDNSDENEWMMSTVCYYRKSVFQKINYFAYYICKKKKEAVERHKILTKKNAYIIYAKNRRKKK